MLFGELAPETNLMEKGVRVELFRNCFPVQQNKRRLERSGTDLILPGKADRGRREPAGRFPARFRSNSVRLLLRLFRILCNLIKCGSISVTFVPDPQQYN